MRRRACRPPLLRATASRGSIGRADPRRQHRDDLPPLLLASAPAFRKDAVNEAVQPSSPPVVAGRASAYHAGGRARAPSLPSFKHRFSGSLVWGPLWIVESEPAPLSSPYSSDRTGGVMAVCLLIDI